MITIVNSLTQQQIMAFQDQFTLVYRDAFSAPPYFKEEKEVLEFAQSLPQHVERPGFRIVAALENEAGPVLGFAYGYANTPGQWWHVQVARAMQPQMVSDWLMNSFRLVEMAVAPTAQGQGLGGLLHDRLLQGLAYQKAVLSTLAAETNAYEMYRKRGWVVLLDNFFPGVMRPYRIMGLKYRG